MANQKQIEKAIIDLFTNSPTTYRAPDTSRIKNIAAAGKTASLITNNSNINKTSNQNKRMAYQIEAITGNKPESSDDGPSNLSRIFDIVSRPKYAVMNALQADIKTSKGLANPNNEDGFFEQIGSGLKLRLKGLGQGITGTKKGSFSDVLKESGASEFLADKGPVGKGALVAASIAGDIILDPTTYASFGTSVPVKAKGILSSIKAIDTATDTAKAADKAAALSHAFSTIGIAGDAAGGANAGLKVVRANAMEQALANAKTLDNIPASIKNMTENEFAIEKIIRTSEDALVNEMKVLDAAHGASITRTIASKRVDEKIKTIRSTGQKVNNTKRAVMVSDEISGVAGEIAKVTANMEPLGKVLTFGTKNNKVAIPFTKSIYGASSVAKKYWLGTELGGDLATKFSSKHLFGAMRIIKRREESAGVAQVEELIKQAKAQFKHLTKEDTARVIQAYMSRQVDYLPENLQLSAKQFKGHMDDIYLNELKTGARNATPGQVGIILRDESLPENLIKKEIDLRATLTNDPNYVEGFIPQYYKGNAEIATKAQQIKREAIKTGRTPWEAEQLALDLGAKPLVKMEEILSNYYSKVSRDLIRRNIKAEAIHEYGIQFDNISDDLAKQLAQEKQLVKLKDNYYLGAPQGTYIPTSIKRSIDFIDELYNDTAKAKGFLKFYDVVLKDFKLSATLLNPASWTRNLVGDMAQGYVAGVRNPKYYKQALTILRADSKETTKTILLGGSKVDTQHILQLFQQSGSKSGFIRAELGSEKYLEKLREMAEFREDVPRLSVWLHSFEKEYVAKVIPQTKKLKELEALNKSQGFKSPVLHRQLDQLRTQISHAEDAASKAAAANVSKWMIDYGDFTKFETNVMRRVVPFYSFMRKNLPLQIEGLAMRPGAYSNTLGAGRSISNILDPDREEEDGIFPLWLRELGFARLGRTDRGGEVVWSPGLPVQDIAKFTEGGREGVFSNLLGSLTPAAAVPIELGTGVDTFTGKDISNQGTNSYLTGQVPLWNTGKNFLTVGKAVATGQTEELSLSYLNKILGLGVQEISPEQQNSELKRQQFVLSGELKKLKDKRKEQILNP